MKEWICVIEYKCDENRLRNEHFKVGEVVRSVRLVNDRVYPSGLGISSGIPIERFKFCFREHNHPTDKGE